MKTVFMDLNHLAENSPNEVIYNENITASRGDTSCGDVLQYKLIRFLQIKMGDYSFKILFSLYESGGFMGITT